MPYELYIAGVPKPLYTLKDMFMRVCVAARVTGEENGRGLLLSEVSIRYW